MLKNTICMEMHVIQLFLNMNISHLGPLDIRRDTKFRFHETFSVTLMILSASDWRMTFKGKFTGQYIHYSSVSDAKFIIAKFLKGCTGGEIECYLRKNSIFHDDFETFEL